MAQRSAVAMSKPVSAARPPAAKKPRTTRTSKPPRELKLYRICNPDFYEKAVTAYSEKDASFALGTADIEEMIDSRRLKKMRRRRAESMNQLLALPRRELDRKLSTCVIPISARRGLPRRGDRE